MKTVLQLLFPILLSTQIFSATITGIVCDTETNEPIPMVNVFLANTTAGDVCDTDGVYLLKNVHPGVYQLVFSHIGYVLQTKQVTLQDNQHLKIDMLLEPRIHQGLELTVEAEDAWQWRWDLRKFKRIFIGETRNARQCKLLNPEYLSFSKNEHTGEFLAQADAPLILENMGLGYKLEVVLTEFRWKGNGGMYAFYPQFTDLSAEYPDKAEKWQKARQLVYLGSLRHFLFQISSGMIEHLYDFQLHQVDEQISGAFRVLRDMPVNPSDLKIELISADPFIKRWEYHGPISVQSYIGNEYSQSFLKLLDGYADIDEFGNLINAREHIASGAWWMYRMADTLPMDYANTGY